MRVILIAVVTLLTANNGIVAQESAHVVQGKNLYTEFCQKCHGADGQKGEGTRTPIWGPDAPRDKFKTVQELFEYLQLLMPFDKPERVSDDQRWDIIAYMMAQHGIMQPSDTLDPAKAATIAIKPPVAGGATSPAPTAAAATSPAPSAPTRPAIAPGSTASAEAGEEVFKLCRACHEVGPNAKNKLGPALNSIIGRKAGTVTGFAYSAANKSAGETGLVWTEAELDTYLADPRNYMPGNRMAFVGVKDDRDRADLIAYLRASSK